ncbi:MAG: ORF6N domain-containing protein [Planctomycetes bacterium]|nr:ORF6N domain-containing protein [Planctomycetota bacterium]
MLSLHLAELYGVETRALIQAVKRNIERFPQDFMFSLNREEIMRISQIVISLKYSNNVYAFTEQGVAMLSGLLNSKQAVQVNIAIMRAFVKLRRVLTSHKKLAQRLDILEAVTSRHDKAIREVFDAIRQLMAKPGPEDENRSKTGFRPR